MPKLFVRIVLALSFLSLGMVSFGQEPEVPPVYLSNYSFSRDHKQNVLCRVTGDNGDQHTLVLTGANADLFALKGNELSLSKRGRKYFKKSGRVSFSIKCSYRDKSIFEKTFTILKDRFAANKVVAHRGAWKNTGLPENSIASLQAAIRLGCAGSEFDIQSTADGKLVIYHDPTYQGIGIERSRYTDLLKYPLQNGEPLPTFENYLKAGITQQKTRLFAEIKPSVIDKVHVLDLAKRMVEEVWRQQAQAWVIYISFDYDALMEVLRLDPSAVTMYLNGDKSPGQLRKDGIQGLSYHYKVYHRQEQWLKEAHNGGMQVNVWTVDMVPEMEYFLAQQVEYITTNEPENLFSLLPKSK